MEVLKSACPEYAEAFNVMIEDLKSAEFEQQQTKIISKFTSKYTNLPKLWPACLALDDFDASIFSDIYTVKYHREAIEKHVEWNDSAAIIIKIKDLGELEEGFKMLEEALKFPHARLEMLWDTYRSYYGKPISQAVYEKFEKSLQLFNDLKSCDNSEEGNDDEQWLMYLENIEDVDVVKANLKFRLKSGTSCLNKNLWKFYFEFLAFYNSLEILEAYRDYTRLFIEDKEIVAEYRDKLESFASMKIPTTKFWIDTIQYERDFGSLKEVPRILERAVKAVTGNEEDFVEKMFLSQLKCWERKMLQAESSWMEEEGKQQQEPMELSVVEAAPPKTHFANPAPQNPCFRSPLLQYIMNKAKPETLKKLYSASKCLYSIHQVPICYKLKTTNHPKTTTFQESLYLNNQVTGSQVIKRFYICDELSWQYFFNRNSLAPLIRKLYRCEARKIAIYGQDLKVQELEALLSEYTIWLEFKDTEFRQNSSTVLDGKQLMEFIEPLPNLSTFIFVNFVELFCVSAQNPNFVAKMLWYCLEYEFETIHLENQILTSRHLHRLIQQRAMKEVVFKNTKVYHFDALLSEEAILEWINTEFDGGVQVLIE